MHEQGRRILISWGAIPESIVDVRVLKNRSNRIEGQILRVVKKSPLEAHLPAKFQVYGGCRWLPIPHEKQLEMKEQQIREVFIHTPEMVQMLFGILSSLRLKSMGTEISSNLVGENTSLLEKESMINTDLVFTNQGNLIV
jgi:tRNA/tmRNA/rRNA uracil-C5-methylase (TrmA/RlmC/RlmD family)